jgi:hypothetical protein
MRKNAKSVMQMQNANAMWKECDAMRWALTKSAHANEMQKSFRTTIPDLGQFWRSSCGQFLRNVPISSANSIRPSCQAAFFCQPWLSRQNSRKSVSRELFPGDWTMSGAGMVVRCKCNAKKCKNAKNFCYSSAMQCNANFDPIFALHWHFALFRNFSHFCTFFCIFCAFFSPFSQRYPSGRWRHLVL